MEALETALFGTKLYWVCLFEKSVSAGRTSCSSDSIPGGSVKAPMILLFQTHMDEFSKTGGREGRREEEGDTHPHISHVIEVMPGALALGCSSHTRLQT